jgi:16S rRNA (cytidine1402-2'-O)-methyltransferase
MLYVVATPIGNLEDMTFRAVRILREANVIACEDTRQTRKLLDHYGITTPMISYHDHNEAPRASELIHRLRNGETVALVTDAGTPLVSDPGFVLVHEARKAGLPVTPIPGASAALTALAASGLPTGEGFRFHGFLPPKKTQRLDALRGMARDPATLVFYEAPHRILETLTDLAETMPARPVVVARELTKLHEEFLCGTAAGVLATLAARDSIRGEITLLVGKATEETAEVDERPLEDAVAELERAGVPRMDAIKQVARDRGLGKREVYKRLSGGG